MPTAERLAQLAIDEERAKKQREANRRYVADHAARRAQRDVRMRELFEEIAIVGNEPAQLLALKGLAEIRAKGMPSYPKPIQPRQPAPTSPELDKALGILMGRSNG